MRRFWILLIVAAMAMALAAPATGKKSENPGKQNPSEVLPQAGFSCADYEKIAPNAGLELRTWDLESGSPMDSIPVTSDGPICIDISNSDPGSFSVEVEEPDGAKRNSILFALIKDSHPGDHCGQAKGAPGSALNLRLHDGEFDDGELAGDITGVPAATINACGIEYSEADVENHGEWVVVNPTTLQDGTPDPLVLMLGITGKPGVTADVTITYKDLP